MELRKEHISNAWAWAQEQLPGLRHLQLRFVVDGGDKVELRHGPYLRMPSMGYAAFNEFLRGYVFGAQHRIDWDKADAMDRKHYDAETKEERRKFTLADQYQYLRDGGLRCPNCDSTDIEADGFDPGMEGRCVTCHACDHMWTECWQITGFMFLADKDGYSYPETTTVQAIDLNGMVKRLFGALVEAHGYAESVKTYGGSNAREGAVQAIEEARCYLRDAMGLDV